MQCIIYHKQTNNEVLTIFATNILKLKLKLGNEFCCSYIYVYDPAYVPLYYNSYESIYIR